MKRPQAAESSCPHNCGINCAGASAKCNYCGWNPAVSKRRIAAIKAGSLSTNEEGKKYLKLNERGLPDAV